MLILEAFDRLPVGGILELPEETDPRALRNEFLQQRAGRFSWEARNLGSGRWTIRIERIDEQADNATFLSHSTPFPRTPKRRRSANSPPTASERSYRQGETIFDEGEMWPYLGFVRTGKVVLTLLSPDGKTHSLGERLAHDALNESGTFDGGGSTTRAEALTDCALVLLPQEAVCTRAATTPNLRSASSPRLRKRAAVRSTRSPTSPSRTCCSASQSSCSPTRRRRPAWRADSPGVENLSQAQIAAAAGTVRDMAARALLRLKNSGAVELDRGRVRALERERLEAFAHGVQAPPV